MTLIRHAIWAALAVSACWSAECAAQPAPAPTVVVPGDHYQCYRVVRGGEMKPEPITVSDQFGRAQIVLARPVMLCNPSLKIHRGKSYPPKARDVHLVCYDAAKQEGSRVRHVKIGNQIQVSDLYVGDRAMFCVPSRKKLIA